MYTFTVAWRYLRRRAISYVAVVLVMTVVIMYMVNISVLEGFKHHYMDKIQSIMSHITVDVGKLAWGIERPDVWPAELAKVDPDIRGITVSLETPAMALFPSGRTIGPLRGVNLQGEFKYGRLKETLTPDSLKELTGFGVHEVNGRKFNGCIVGGAWRREFDLQVGDRILFLFTNDSDDPAPQMVNFYVIGFFEGKNPYLEQSAYVDLKVLADYVGVPGRAKSMHIWLEHPNRADLASVKEKVARKMHEILIAHHPEIAPRLTVETWQEKDNNFYEAITRENWMMRVIMSLFLMLTAFILFLIFSRLVAEKIRDIGALRALGASPAGIRRCFLLQGIIVGVLGLLLGLILSEVLLREMNPILKWWGVSLFSKESLAAGEIPYRTLSFDRWLISAVTLFSAWMGALIPALVASWKNPVECLRHE